MTDRGDILEREVLESAAELPWDPFPPSYFIRNDILYAHGLTQSDLADRLGVARRTVNELVGNKRGISIDMARRLSQLTGQSAEYWLNLQTQFDLWRAQKENGDYDIIPLDRVAF